MSVIEGHPLDTGRVASYLARLGIAEPIEASPAWLERLHVAHLRTVPFENLEIHAGRPIRLGLDGLHDKIVTNRRGGFCYELNGLFGALLTSVGFEVTLVSCRVRLPDGTLTEPFDHAALLVDLEGPWLADVGFGDAFLLPRPLGAEWSEPERTLRTVPTAGGWRLERDEGGGWQGMYDLDPSPRRLEDFAGRCRWHETAPEGPFRQGPFVSRATEDGRVTLLGDRLHLTVDGERTERELPDEAAFRDTLRTYFDEELAEPFTRGGIS